MFELSVIGDKDLAFFVVIGFLILQVTLQGSFMLCRIALCNYMNS